MEPRKLSSVLYRVPWGEQLDDGTMIDGWRDIGPDDPDFARWTEMFDEAAAELSKKEKR